MPFRNKQVPFWVVTFLLVFGMAVRAASDKGATILALARLRSDGADAFFSTITHLGDALPYWITGICLLMVRIRYALTVGLLGLITLVVTGMLKTSFGHPRPYTWFGSEDLLHLLTPVEGTALYDAYNSFPSGHSLAAFTLFVFLALIAHRIWLQVLCVAIATAVGISRMYLQLHFLEDVLFGALCGTLLATMGYYLQERHLAAFRRLDTALLRVRPTRD